MTKMTGRQFENQMRLAQVVKGDRQLSIIASAIFEYTVGRVPDTSNEKDSEQLAIITQTVSHTRDYFFKEEFKEQRPMAYHFQTFPVMNRF